MQLPKKFVEAVEFARDAHGVQTRKGTGVTYVAHLLGVASIALEYGADEEEAMAAMLHDVGEDAGGEPTMTRVKERFGERIEAIVRGCSDTLVKPKPEWEKRKRDYLAHLPTASKSVQLVSAADKVYNATAILRDLCTIGERVWEKFSVKQERTLWYYRELVRAYNRSYCPGLVEELERVVKEIHQKAKVEWV